MSNKHVKNSREPSTQAPCVTTLNKTFPKFC